MELVLLLALPSNANEDIGTTFYGLDINGDFKVRFRAIFDFVNVLLANRGILYQMLGVSSVLGIRCVGGL